MEAIAINQLEAQIREAVSKRNQAKQLLSTLENQLINSEKEYSKKQNNFFGKLFSNKESVEKLSIEIDEIKNKISSTKTELDSLSVSVDKLHSGISDTDYNELLSQFLAVSQSNKIWKVISQEKNTVMKSSAGTSVEKQEVSFSIMSLDFINSKFKAFYIKNVSAPGLFIYPSFVLQFTSGDNVSVTDIKDISFSFLPQRFIESKYSIPSDSKVVDQVWDRVNKDGSRDLRYAGNYQKPVVQYGVYHFRSTTGIDLKYYISNYEAAAVFADNFNRTILNPKRTNYTSISKDSSTKDESKFFKRDPLFVDAARLIVANQIGSTFLIQRKMKLGYNRAGKLMDDLEEAGIIGKNDGFKAREVFIKNSASLEEFLIKLDANESLKFISDEVIDPTFQFTKQYYNLLSDFVSELISLTERLREDKILTDRFINAAGKTKMKDFITYCVIYDLNRLTKILSNNNLDAGSLEAAGLTLIASKILPDSQNDFRDRGYNLVAQMYENGSYKDLATSIIDLGNNTNPLKINVKHTGDDERILSNHDVESNLSLPAALKILDHTLFDEYATALYKFSNIISKADNKVSKAEEEKLKEIFQLIHNPIEEKTNAPLIVNNTDEPLESTLSELDSLTGLEDVKKEIRTLINFIKIQKAREASGLKSSSISYHIVFSGNPGTGKTTVARIVAKIYKALGISSQGQLVETDRSGLIAEYIGQTAIKVNKVIDSALNGILFIDEAYSITSEIQNDYGKEAIATLIKRMEDDRDKLIVIVAGYTNEMNKFIEANPGLKSRFNRKINFADYSSSELMSIYESLCLKSDYQINDEAKNKLIQIFNKEYSERDNSFGNGRFVRNLFEKTLEIQANRIASVASLNTEILSTITENDIP